VVRLGGAYEPVVHIEAIESAGDPRLLSTSLDGLLECIEIEVRGPDGALVPRFEVRHTSALEEPREEKASGGRVTIVTRGDEIAVEVSAARCASRLVEHVREATVVHLDRAPVVRLRSRDDAPVPPGGLDSSVWAGQAGRKADRWPTLVLAGGREASLELPRAGAWKTRWYAKNPSRNQTIHVETDEVSIEVGGDDVVVTLDRPAADIARAFERLAK
jgi:hypothetical protein